MAPSSSAESIPLLPLHNPSGPSSSSFASSSRHHEPSAHPTSSPPQPELGVTIRFATALPDLSLALTTPHNTAVSALKRLIRTSRPEDTAKRRLRLIYAGKVLGDQSVIGEVVGLPRTISQSASKSKNEAAYEEAAIGKGKGKARLVDEEAIEVTEDIRSVYVHCSIGDILTEKELSEEAESESLVTHQPSTLPAPQGFDRLLSAGFTESDIAALRSQFHGTLLPPSSPTTTADTNSLSLLDEEARRRALSLEERWIDESANAADADTTNATGATGGWGTSGGSYEDFFVGVLWGFFWPVCVVWMFREEGLLGSQRKQMAVLAGLLVNFAFSVLRFSS